jgi:hypothetical protein
MKAGIIPALTAVLFSCSIGAVICNHLWGTVNLGFHDLDKDNQPTLETALKYQGRKYSTGNAKGQIGTYGDKNPGDALASFGKQSINEKTEYRGVVYGIEEKSGKLLQIATYTAILQYNNHFKAILNQTLPLYMGEETFLFITDGKGKLLVKIPFNNSYKGYYGAKTETGRLGHLVFNKPDAIKAKLAN